MPRTPLIERSGSIKVLGIGFLAMVVFFVWLTYAVFNKNFVSYVPVSITGSETGLSLPKNADVKLRGQFVGEVRSLESTPDGVKLNVRLKPEVMDAIPAGVTARIIPKTLFGEKYVSLVPPTFNNGETLQAGATIPRAEVPIEVEKLLNDLYPLLEAVRPAELSTTLTVVSQALEGRGEKLGTTLVTFNDYLKKSNPDLPQLITDLEKLGQVSDVYAAALPDLGELLRNSVTTGNTVVAKRTQLAAFLDEGARLADSLTVFFDRSGDDIVGGADESRVVLETTADYSSIFPCFTNALNTLLPRLNSVVRGGIAHIDLRILGQQPTGYANSENAKIVKKTLDSSDETQPNCRGLDDLPALIKKYGNGPGQKPYNEVDPKVYKLVGIESSHNKFGTDADFNRTAVANMLPSSLDGVDNAQQRGALRMLLGAQLGVTPSSVPDIGTLLAGPILRGSEVSVE